MRHSRLEGAAKPPLARRALALALIFGLARKYLYIIGALFSLTIWGTAEGFGGPYGPDSTDIGAAVMYAVVFMGLLALNHEGGASRFSIDYLIEQRVSWWIASPRPETRPKPASSSSAGRSGASHRRSPMRQRPPAHRL
ncbi:MAG: hypothetical protein ACYC91_16890 [Solirubrobacteraceae bacterium]